MKTKTVNFSILLMLAIFAILPLACKKESNDPNIEDRVINRTINATSSGTDFGFSDSMDIDMDGINDLFSYSEGSDSSQMISTLIRNGRILMEPITIESIGQPFGKELSVGTVIDSASVTWYNYAFLSVKSIKVSHSVDLGIHGKGDKYFGFALMKSGTDVLYGWIKVNLSNDFKKFTIIELAVQKIVNKSIKAGEK